MALAYQNLLHNVGIRLNALVGSQKAALDTTYDTANLVAGSFKSADWPFGAFRDAILMAEEDFCWAIADTANHPWRSNISSVTANMATGSNIPAVDTTVVKIIGVIGGVYDTTDGLPLHEASRDRILRINRMALGIPEYLYCIDGRRIYHTRTNVIAEVCILDRAARVTAFNANGNSLLPEVLEPGITARAAGLLAKTTLSNDLAASAMQYSETALQRIRQGLTSVLPKAVPVESLAGN